MTTFFYAILFLFPIVAIPLFCAWLFCKRKIISSAQSYLINGLLMFLLPFIWSVFQDPVEISNQIPIFRSASIFFLGNIIFGIPTSLINQILMNFLLSSGAEEKPIQNHPTS
jgi:hypothetical protein